jgi:peptidoglycan hydrolase-like protein with peptidoglycan-binding domain
MTPRRARQALCLFLLLAAAVAHNALFRQTRPVAGGSSAVATVPSAGVPSAAVPSANVSGQRTATAAGTALAERPAGPAKDPPGQRPPTAPSAGLAERPSSAAKEAPEKRLGTGRFKPEGANTEVGSVTGIAVKQEVARIDTIRAIQRELRQRGYGALVSDGRLRLATRAAIMAYEYDHGLPLTGQASEPLLARILFGGAPAADPAAAGKVRSAEAQEVVRSVQQWLAALGYQPGAPDGQLQAETIRAIREFEMDKGLVPKGRISAELVGQLAAPLAPPRLSRR